ncbi:DNA-binding transcriptional MocR family regulator [Streptosporangium becharense]|uniref:DNA-binding transcriptional MocR family regulator n=1 Tax=Streptosporangium becharense TaxID=1816182 RepID=A0A7W9IMF3_9ACTN|nr:hypothetical protein [Streptosporangium becharense]MBB2914587.1 DNA-binding transcriptional MocR family regulator [Streptosporangium becharense]MBB5823432.1 DNA-binding transcriptional MocR family regulator [Streptosporangium becharense]
MGSEELDRFAVLVRDRLRLREGGESPSRRLAGALSDLAEVGALARRYGVAPGSLFSADGRHRDRLRLSFALPPALLDQAVTGLAGAWRDRGR